MKRNGAWRRFIGIVVVLCVTAFSFSLISHADNELTGKTLTVTATYENNLLNIKVTGGPFTENPDIGTFVLFTLDGEQLGEFSSGTNCRWMWKMLVRGNLSTDSFSASYEIPLSDGEHIISLVPFEMNETIYWVAENAQSLPTEAPTVIPCTIIIRDGIQVNGSEGGNPSEDTLQASNFTAPTDTYFADAGITITPSDTDLSFTVASQDDKACVVSKVNEDGTYTVLPVTTKDGVHTYTAGSADDQIVVALKGDANGDGNVTNSDVTRMKAILNGKYANSAITALCADANGDSNFTNSDVTRLKAVMNGKSTISW